MTSVSTCIKCRAVTGNSHDAGTAKPVKIHPPTIAGHRQACYGMLRLVLNTTYSWTKVKSLELVSRRLFPSTKLVVLRTPKDTRV